MQRRPAASHHARRRRARCAASAAGGCATGHHACASPRAARRSACAAQSSSGCQTCLLALGQLGRMRRRDSRPDRCRHIWRSRRRPRRGAAAHDRSRCWRAASAAAQRLDGVALRLPFARRSLRRARGSARPARAFAGVRTGLPSSTTAKPPSRGDDVGLLVEALHLSSGREIGEGIALARFLEAEEIPRLAHMRRQRRGHGERLAARDAAGRWRAHEDAACALAARLGGCAAAPPYLPSPRIGVPSASACTRS